MSTDRKSAGSTTRRTRTGTTGAAKAAPPKPTASRTTKTGTSQTGAKQSQAAQPTPTQAPDQTTTERAEEVFDELGQRIGVFALVARDYLVRATARAREEGEDILAEAQHLRVRK